MRILETKLYKFIELSEKAKTKAIDDYQPEFIDDFIIDQWADKLQKQGFNDPSIVYNGFWSQGDGASFTCSSIDLNRYKSFNLLQWAINRGSLDLNINITRSNSRYYHELSTSINVDYNIFDDLNNNLINFIERSIDKLELFLTNYIVDINRNIYNDLYQGWQHQNSDSTKEGILIDYDSEFYSDGGIYNG